MVPEPRQPRRQSSSPKCANAELTRAYRPVRQTPTSSASRSTPQLRGQTRQSRSSSAAWAARSYSSPSSSSAVYAGQGRGIGEG